MPKQLWGDPFGAEAITLPGKTLSAVMQIDLNRPGFSSSRADGRPRPPRGGPGAPAPPGGLRAPPPPGAPGAPRGPDPRAALAPGGRAGAHRPPMSIADAQRLRTARSSLEGHEG